jgi:hypothetical protein
MSNLTVTVNAKCALMGNIESASSNNQINKKLFFLAVDFLTMCMLICQRMKQNTSAKRENIKNRLNAP